MTPIPVFKYSVNGETFNASHVFGKYEINYCHEIKAMSMFCAYHFRAAFIFSFIYVFALLF